MFDGIMLQEYFLSTLRHSVAQMLVVNAISHSLFEGFAMDNRI